MLIGDNMKIIVQTDRKRSYHFDKDENYSPKEIISNNDDIIIFKKTYIKIEKVFASINIYPEDIESYKAKFLTAIENNFKYFLTVKRGQTTIFLRISNIENPVVNIMLSPDNEKIIIYLESGTLEYKFKDTQGLIDLFKQFKKINYLKFILKEMLYFLNYFEKEKELEDIMRRRKILFKRIKYICNKYDIMSEEEFENLCLEIKFENI